jgi:hypothetical protein
MLFRKRKDHWRDVDSALAVRLVDARLQLHHAAQFVATAGISYLPKADDDSHTNMRWLGGALAGQPLGDRPIRVAVRANPFSLAILGGDATIANLELHGRTIADATAWLRKELDRFGLDGDRYSSAKHYTIPAHAVERGAPFDASDTAAFEQLDRWYDDADQVLEAVAEQRTGSPVRCWPHHFDIATLIAPRPHVTIGVGLSPGDDSYAEPYWYVNRYPVPPEPPAVPALAGKGHWHQEGWFGAVLTGSRTQGRQQVADFIQSAVDALSKL